MKVRSILSSVRSFSRVSKAFHEFGQMSQTSIYLYTQHARGYASILKAEAWLL